MIANPILAAAVGLATIGVCAFISWAVGALHARDELGDDAAYGDQPSLPAFMVIPHHGEGQ